MIDWTDGFVISFFLVSTISLSIYGLHLYVLLFLFRRRVQAQCNRQRTAIDAFGASASDEDWPGVTSQIPLFNEIDVVRRIMHAVAALDYPRGKHEIQILDDSNDGSDEIIDRIAFELGVEGIDVKVIRRASREGYKAGALANGLVTARGELIAVFDADFVPPPDFLRRAIPLMVRAPDLACLQGRWGHLNADESWLTRAQALGIDGHFAVEQGARAWNGLMMNFNGTAGIWRKSAINDPAVGGWSGDTLTEDLDLSYRAQLAGWRIEYALDLACPAELPGTINAFKSQQRRWATGSVQVARKLLPRIWRAPLTFGQRLEATLHLTHYTVSVWMLILALVARPMLLIHTQGRAFSAWLWVLWAVIFASAIAPALTYTYARRSLGGGWSGLRLIPQMMALGCGMCLNNAAAVIRGLFARGGEFVRTPKSGSEERVRLRSSYAPVQTHVWLMEIALGLYSLMGFAFFLATRTQWAVSVFLLLYGVGFLTVGFMSIPRRTLRHNEPTPRPLSTTPTLSGTTSLIPTHHT